MTFSTQKVIKASILSSDMTVGLQQSVCAVFEPKQTMYSMGDLRAARRRVCDQTLRLDREGASQ